MFGGQNTIGSSWGQPQQNQQPGTSSFGQPSGASGFGSGGGKPQIRLIYALPRLTIESRTQHLVLAAPLVNSNNNNHKLILCSVDLADQAIRVATKRRQVLVRGQA